MYYKTIKTACAVISGALFVGCGSHESREAGTINVATAISSPTELKVSDLGKTITYIPLATTDSSLMGSKWELTVTDNLVLVRNGGNIIVNGSNSGMDVIAFNLADGSYLNHVGHGGQDGEAYRFPFFTVDTKTNILTFDAAANDKWIKYAADGRFISTYPKYVSNDYSPRPQIIDDTVSITALQSNAAQGNPFLSVIFTSESGRLLDSIPVVSTPDAGETGPLYFGGSVTFDTFDGYIPYSKASGIAFFQEGAPGRYSSPAPCLWRAGNEYHALMGFSDTIYSVAMGRTPEAALVFDMDGKGYPAIENGKRDMTENDLMIGEIIETPSTLIFCVSKGWNKRANAFIGLYDKKTGTTRATKAIEGFADDLTGLMPFFPITATPDGRYVGIVTQEDIAKWVEEHPEAELPETLQAIVDSEEEPNPVLVIVK